MNLPEKLGVFGNVVTKLVKNLPENKNFKFYFDNWFSSVDLVGSLNQQSTWSVATILPNRLKGCTLLSTKIETKGRGSIDYQCEETEGISVIKWYDNKPIYLISTFCSVDPTDQCKRWSVSEKKGSM